MNQFQSYHNLFEGKTAWIFGKGPSLELINYLNVPPDVVKIGINESCRLVPCNYIFAHDEITLPHIWDASGIFILEYRFKELIPIEQLSRVIFYNKYQDDLDGSFENLIGWPTDIMRDNEMLVGYQGTVHSAIHFCHYTGIKNIVLLGFDHEEGNVYYNHLKQFTEISETFLYDVIYQTVLRMAKILNISIKRIRLLQNET